MSELANLKKNNKEIARQDKKEKFKKNYNKFEGKESVDQVKFQKTLETRK